MAFAFLFLSLFSTYHQNEQYQKQKEARNKNRSNAKLYAKHKVQVKSQHFMTNQQGDIKQKDSETNTKSSTSGDLGCISLQKLNEFDCNHTEKRLVSLFGLIFDVTSNTDKYGVEGSHKEFAGHDITLCLGTGKMNSKWLDKFVWMEEKHEKFAKEWLAAYTASYPMCGSLKEWSGSFDTSKWPKLSAEELEELNRECIVM